MLRYVLNRLEPTKSEERSGAKSKSAAVLKRLGLKDLHLTEHETIIAAEVVHPDDISVRFEDVGGLDPIIVSLRETVIYPLRFPNLFRSASNLISAPKGVLLYGPPGCGKTMLAKALAKESGATFINITASVITDKWFGESNKLVDGLFSLARKMQPSIIFIDEIDTFLRDRARGDHEAMGMLKAEFMTLWDGLTSSDETRVLVLGATNRPEDIDPAIYRRLPKRFGVGLPDASQRQKILELMLRNTPLDPTLDMQELVRETVGMSGSDLRELCRVAALAPVQEFMRTSGGTDEQMAEAVMNDFKLRPLRIEDFPVHEVKDLAA
ncbi:AAA-domain-containing protein [Dacryopinax primogenitus]|uniref:AAA-domain-containing protein n=1 Tax=Dacryopinax primogenitus (strain DJM 731) TaxID=1858805 RepID=M5G2Y7_DACPD|nr:AAA-domain-containing protein [Dacryopinax primogenitus]EJU03064.1 AAA-domain-containing protein [Dacryopinax primogenitus]